MTENSKNIEFDISATTSVSKRDPMAELAMEPEVEKKAVAHPALQEGSTEEIRENFHEIEKVNKEGEEISLDEAVEFDAKEISNEKSEPDIIAEKTEDLEKQQNKYEATDEPGTIVEEPKKPIFVENQVLTISNKETFDANSVQDITKNTNGPEGGISVNRTPRSRATSVTQNEGGGIIKPAADMQADSIPNKYELSGFEAIYEVNNETHRVHIRDYYDDLKTAQASINEGKYLMPMPGGLFAIAAIKGVPTISFNERQVMAIKNGAWSKF